MEDITMKKLLVLGASLLVLSVGATTFMASQSATGEVICDNRGGNFVDENGDGICDNRGRNFVDADGDGVCDNKAQCRRRNNR